MSTVKHNKKQIELLLNLYTVQPWLAYKNEAVMELCADCDSFEEFILICELLKRFTYVKRSNFGEFLQNVYYKISGEWSLPVERTIIVATTADAQPDSAQLIIYELQPVLSRNGWCQTTKGIFFNALHGALREMNKRAGVDAINIVFIDEFVGTGDTMESRIRSTRNHLEGQCGISAYTIKVCVLASMEQGKDKIDSSGIDCYVHTVLKKGLAGYLSNEELRQAYHKMLRLESILASQIGDIELPSLGYGEAEALYARQGYSEEDIANSPNSIFPIFWWPQYSNATARRTVLHRAL